ncbi:MAG: glycoside hydrolase family 3 N-terminal domain-containing protein, partial [Cytophagaceae bacterium]
STIFPHNLNLAATRNPELVYKASEITAAETRASGIRYNFSPVLDVGRNQVWSRFPESFGEDVELVKILGTESVKGYQGKSLKNPNAVAACMKHFIGYSVPANGKDRAPAYIPEIVLREYFLPPFRESVKAGAATLMVNSGDVNGTPVHASKYLLTDVLRGELGFEGVIISDWLDIQKLHERHNVASTHKEAVLKSVEAGIDMVIVPFDFSFYDDLVALVKEGKVSEERINQSVRRILKIKKDLGLFEDPYVEAKAIENFGKPEYKQSALQAARESIVLLKNDDLLPLKMNASVFLTGPAANSLTALHGAWSYTWQGTKADYFTPNTLSIFGALKASGVNVSYHRGSNFTDSLLISGKEMNKYAASADAIVVCIGEEAFAETPGNIFDMNLPGVQQQLVKMASATGKPVILVLVEGRPRVIREIEPLSKSILFAGWPGSQGGNAVADILFGKYNPNGKLPFTYPRYPNELLTYDHKPLDVAVEIVEPEYQYFFDFRPQFHFGDGLSYTTFAYSDLTINKEKIHADEKLEVSVKITNTGILAGQEVVELYTRDLYASIVPPVKRLRKFTKINLEPGESMIVTFTLDRHDLAFVNEQLKTITEPGEFEVLVKGLKKGFNWEER